MSKKKLKDIIYIEKEGETEWEFDYIPASAIDHLIIDDFYDAYVAYIDTYYFATYEGVSYLVLKLYTSGGGFNFLKFYPINDGMNRELRDILIMLRAIRSHGANYIDFGILLEHHFQFDISKEDDRYYIHNMKLRMNDYEECAGFTLQCNTLEELIENTYHHNK